MVEIGVRGALAIKTGTTKDGKKWAFGEVKADKGYDKIMVWAENPDELKDGAARIKEIVSVKKSAKKYEKDGETKWADVYSINAVLEPASVVPSGFEQISDEDVPF